jgi:glycosyltransferase involved in cell wall biosynthesis
MKILYVTTVSGTMDFFKSEFSRLLSEGHELELACNCAIPVETYVDTSNIVVHNLPFSRSPFSTDNLNAYKELKRLVRKNHYDIVHCHTPNAATITRLVCKRIRKNGTQVIYTAHGFHFYKGAPKKNWMIYYPVEWFCAHWTDILITINTEDYELAKRKMKANRVEYVPGVGVELEKFENNPINKIEKRKQLGIPEDAILLLSVGELNENKNHETVLRAIAGMDVYYLIAGKGNKEQELNELAKSLKMETRFKLLGYRTDIAELLQTTDVFVFPSYREGLSVSLMETMASGKPAVVSRIRGNTDLIDENGGALFNPYSVNECREAIQRVVNADRGKMGNYNKEKVKKFVLEGVLEKIDRIYGG